MEAGRSWWKVCAPAVAAKKRAERLQPLGGRRGKAVFAAALRDDDAVDGRRCLD